MPSPTTPSLLHVRAVVAVAKGDGGPMRLFQELNEQSPSGSGIDNNRWRWRIGVSQ